MLRGLRTMVSCMTFDECHDVRTSQAGDLRIPRQAMLPQTLPSERGMANGKHARQPALLDQISFKILHNLFELVQCERWLGRHCIDLSKQTEQSDQCRTITEKSTSISATELLILVYRLLVDVVKLKPFACEPMTEVASHAKIAPCSLPTMSLSQQPCCEQIDMNSQRPFVKPFQHLGTVVIRFDGHAYSFPPE
ncbi:hypothetical protein A6V36_27385 [Paraburkholderia ginsengiterrae]|uniref:Uncharacterized protein n=2 Tax=Paraburkholderia ginsengiterrae TaxID=1462993 RepID=A0A1A9NBT6_9BURK|nr:hypothetical protein A6V36_27385 [Paraburkholderia ginsengiterrae]OAJ63286.1 hypothetical protein A6V37_20530 [Paraburkholderia ginsengiterrae]